MASQDDCVPARKRPRLSQSQPDAKDTHFERDTTFWYEDGTIILVAGGVGFRFYQGSLAERSAIFRDMFKLPQPVDAENVEGCPVVQLSESAIDIRAFLRTIINGVNHCQCIPATINIYEIAAWVHISQKYDIPALCAHATSCLEKLYPKNLEFYSILDKDHHDLQRRSILAVNLARATESHHLLPAMLYCCCQLPISALLNGIKRSIGGDSDVVDQLSRVDLQLCLEARDRITIRFDLAFSHIFKPVSSASCVTAAICRQEIKWTTNLYATIATGYCSRGVLQTWCGIPDVTDVCEKCEDMINARDLKERKKAWNDLPKLMGVEVPSWPQVPLTQD